MEYIKYIKYGVYYMYVYVWSLPTRRPWGKKEVRFLNVGKTWIKWVDNVSR